MQFFYIQIDIIRANCVTGQQSSGRSNSPTSSNTSAVQWAWYTVTALGEQSDEDCSGNVSGNSGNISSNELKSDVIGNISGSERKSEISGNKLKSEIRASLSQLGARDLLLATLMKYGTISATGSGSADVIQWTFSAMSVLASDRTFAQFMLSTNPVSTSDTNNGGDGKDSERERESRNRGNTVVEKVVSNYSFFTRAISTTTLAIDVDTDDSDLGISNAITIIKAMNANLNNSDVAEEFCNAVRALIATPVLTQPITTPTSTPALTSTSQVQIATETQTLTQIQTQTHTQTTTTHTATTTTSPKHGLDSGPNILQRNKQFLIAAGVNELLVKILVAHENSHSQSSGFLDTLDIGVVGDEEVSVSPVLESCFDTIAEVRL